VNATAQLEYVRCEKLGNCTRCGLHQTRSNLVFGAGSPDAKVLLVGDAPGFNEDRVGLPFVGSSGQILNNLLRHSGLRREEIYLANAVKCRPPDKRDPSTEELAACLPFLHAQIAIIKPDVLIALGRDAGNILSGQRSPLSMEALQERDWVYRHGPTGMTIPVVCLPHPAHIHRNLQTPDIKALYRDAVNRLRRALAAHIPLDLDI
jgi:DNA polymerase